MMTRMSPASRNYTTTSSARSQRSSPLNTTSRPLRKASASMQLQEPYGVSMGHQDNQRHSMAATDTKQVESHGGIHASVQHEGPPTTVTDQAEGAETSKPAPNQQVRSQQDQHEKGGNRDRNRTPSLESQDSQLAEELDYSQQLAAALAQRDEMLREKDAELTRKENKIRELSAANHKQNDEIQRTGVELRHVKTKHQQTSQLLKERSEELDTAQKFLGKADSISSTEVVRLVETLNAEITQHSHFILDSLKYRKWAGSTPDLEHLLNGLHDLLGPQLIDHLWRRLNDPKLEFDELLTQLALQTGLTNACTYIINHWNPPFWNSGKILDRVYGEMGRNVGQVVAGKWRALSSTYLDVNRNANRDHLRGALLTLISAVGGPVAKSLPPDMMNKVDDVTKKTLEIRKHVWISFTSMDLEVYSIQCGTQFDTSQMEDADDPNAAGGKGKAEISKRRGIVMCTLEMGLRYKKRVSSGNQSEIRTETDVILKSKVKLVDARDHAPRTAPCRQM